MNTPQEFGSLLAGVRRLADHGFASGGGALATLTRTSGSTFRRAGARMLVCGDGTVVRGLSGGCPEADIIGRARDVIADGAARIVRYDRESGLDVLLELGCGGTLEVLIEPLTRTADIAFLDAAARCLDARRSGVLATVFSRDNAVLAPKPRRMVIDEGRIMVNEFGAGLISGVLADQMLEHPPGPPAVVAFSHGGNHYEALLEALIPPYALFIVGINAAAVALARIAAVLGWQVTLIDDRDDRVPPGVLPDGVRRVTASASTIHDAIEADARSFAVVMTHNLGRDIDYLRALAEMPLAYLGSLGSRSRVQRLRDGSGLPATRLRAPAGLDLGAETPEEIALAISAEILALTSGRRAESLSQTTGPIHA